MTTVYERLKALQITLPDVPPPVVDGYVAAFVPFVRTGNLVYLSGRLAKKKWQALVRQSGRAYYHTRGQTSRTRHCHRIAHHTTSRPRGPGQNKTDREAAGDGEQHTEFYRAARGCQRRVRTFPRNLWRALEHMRAHLMEAIRSVVPRLGDTQSKRNTRAEPGICAPRFFCGQYNNSTIEDDG